MPQAAPAVPIALLALATLAACAVGIASTLIQR
jgi:hypothetical protein